MLENKGNRQLLLDFIKNEDIYFTICTEVQDTSIFSVHKINYIFCDVYYTTPAHKSKVNFTQCKKG